MDDDPESREQRIRIVNHGSAQQHRMRWTGLDAVSRQSQSSVVSCRSEKKKERSENMCHRLHSCTEYLKWVWVRIGWDWVGTGNGIRGSFW